MGGRWTRIFKTQGWPWSTFWDVLLLSYSLSAVPGPSGHAAFAEMSGKDSHFMTMGFELHPEDNGVSLEYVL